MAEFCLECWNQINETHDSKWRYVLTRDLEQCEECGRYRRVIVVERFWSRTQRTLTEILDNLRCR